MKMVDEDDLITAGRYTLDASHISVTFDAGTLNTNSIY